MNVKTRRTFSRRRFLIAAAPLALGSLLFVEAVRRRLASSVEQLAGAVWSPARRIRAHFPYLTIDDGDVDQFVGDHTRARYRLSNVRPWASDVYLTFLLSTDFFAHAADERRPVRYVRFHEPGGPCGNPFATFD